MTDKEKLDWLEWFILNHEGAEAVDFKADTGLVRSFKMAPTNLAIWSRADSSGKGVLTFFASAVERVIREQIKQRNWDYSLSHKNALKSLNANPYKVVIEDVNAIRKNYLLITQEGVNEETTMMLAYRKAVQSSK